MQITGPEVDAEKNASSETPSGKSSKKKDQQTVSVANPQLSFKESELKKRFAEVFKKFQADQKKKESKSKNRNNSGAGNLLELDAQKELFLAFRSDITAAPKNLKEADKS